MKFSYFKHWLFWVKALILAVSLFFIAATIDHGFWHYGKHPMLTNPEFGGPLMRRFPPDVGDGGNGSGSNGGSGIGYEIAVEVGGIASQGIAKPRTNLSFNNISVQYNPDQVDGKRLQINIDGQQIDHQLPDWMLIPIANFANSDYHAVVSLFGEQTDSIKYDITYHPAFINTLLGVRLLHSDILFIDLGEFWKVPEYDGEVIFSNEERLPSGTNHWNSPANAISDVFVNGDDFQSWILLDLKTEFEFDVINNQLKLEGLPYYFFWEADWEGYVNHFNALATEANQALANGDIARYNVLVDSANNLEPIIYDVESLTEEMQNAYSNVEAYNNFAYDATVATFQYAAFFRYLKANHSNTWNNFIASIENISTTPEVFTPTVWWYNDLIPNKKIIFNQDILGPVKIYPNPTTGLFNFSVTNKYTSALNIALYNMAGAQLLHYQASGNTKNFEDQLDISAYPPGMYFIRVSTGPFVSTGKILKQ